MNQTNSQSGFTLIEILVAVLIFAIMSVIALTGIKSVSDAQQMSQKVTADLQQLQNTLFYLEQDLHYALDRPVRDELGDELPAIIAGNTVGQGIQLTRIGQRNPQGLNRSSLMRIGYRLRENELLRERYARLDRTAEQPSQTRVLMQNIEEFEYRFLHTKDGRPDWSSFWPPIRSEPGPIALPRAVEIRIKHTSLGDITRLIDLPG